MESLISLLSYIFSFAIVIIILVFVHELGHFLAARACGVKVQVFAIGLGPRIFGFFDKKGTMWQFSLLPLGGYVKMLGGEAILDPKALNLIPPEERRYAFPLKPLLQRMFIVIAGPLANVILSILVFTFIFALHGRYVPAPYNEIGIASVQENAPAEKAGLKSGDIITHYNRQLISSFNELRLAIQKSKDNPTPLTVSRESSTLNLTITPRPFTRDNRTVFLIGVTNSQGRLQKDNPLQALSQAFVATYRISFFIGESLKGFVGSSFSSSSSSSQGVELAGPLGIASMARDAVQGGLVVLATTIAIWSVNLAIFNLLPIPVLDGGHIALFLIEALTGKPLNYRAQRVLTTIGVSLLLSLFVYVSYGDILRIFS